MSRLSWLNCPKLYDTVPTKSKKRSKKYLGETEVGAKFCNFFVSQEGLKLNIFTGSVYENPMSCVIGTDQPF